MSCPKAPLLRRLVQQHSPIIHYGLGSVKHLLMALNRAFNYYAFCWRMISYNNMPPATAAFSDPTFPHMGIRIR